ncbi:MAG TPA: MogA/MoaB family molybdenum cofactor biosynthesis protein [Thermomicrobiales bacterium]|nr:MogA/MoaB family molybdenum cofactor biosynthesis protein [Thermomicrobiales bacterium]
MSIGIVTISDTRTLDDDTGGALIAELVGQSGHVVASRSIVRDDRDNIVSAILDLAGDPAVDVAISTGGTGIARRDVTYEAVSSILDRELAGFGELFRMLSWEEIGSAAMLSRATAGAIGSTAVFALPGSRNAIRLAMERLILPEIAHVVYEIRK